MSRTITIITGIFTALLIVPLVASAQDVIGFIDQILMFIDLLVPLLITIAVAIFFWGIVKFITNAGDERAIDEGKQLMIWGMVGLFVIVGLWGLVGFIQESLGLDMGGMVGNGPELPTYIP